MFITCRTDSSRSNLKHIVFMHKQYFIFYPVNQIELKKCSILFPVDSIAQLVEC